MTEAMPFLQKTILLSYDPRPFGGGGFGIFFSAPAVCQGALRPLPRMGGLLSARYPLQARC